MAVLETVLLAVAAASNAQQQEADRLGAALGLPVVSPDDTAHDLLLILTPERLELQQTGSDAPGPVYADFVAGRSGHRRRFGGGRGQPLARAVGLKEGRRPLVLDATGGLGRDAFVLASLGCTVHLLERSPVVAALLRDAMHRARQQSEVAPILQRMRLHCVDAIGYLNELETALLPDVVYLDPMYPKRGKKALVKKEMRLLQRVVGADHDGSALLEAARRCARFRVVVKRPAGASCLGESTPSMSVSSPNTRYDVYVRRRFDPPGKPPA